MSSKQSYIDEKLFYLLMKIINLKLACLRITCPKKINKIIYAVMRSLNNQSILIIYAFFLCFLLTCDWQQLGIKILIKY